MKTNYKSNIIGQKGLWQIISAVCLSGFLLVLGTFAQMPPRANGKIAFSNNNEIYSINPDGTDLRHLTFNPGMDAYPAWSPDGRKIAYLNGQSVIKIMNADGSGQQIVTPINYNLNTPNFCGERFSLDWSPDGSKIVFQEFGNIVTVNVDGTNRQNVTNTPLRESEPSWGPTGLIAYDSTLWGGDDINGLDIRTTDGGSYAGYGYFTCSISPDLSPDGTELAYIHSYDFPPPGFITIVPVIHNPPLVRSFNFYNVTTVRWSPDSNFLVFGTFQNQIEIVDEFGQGRRILTQGTNPSWGALSATSTDFDGDGRADVSVFRPADRTWYLNQSTNGFSATQFGLSTDKITPADFDGDGKTDISVFRNGTWYWLNSSNGSFNAIQFGLAGDVPVPSDYTGDGRAELGIYRNGTWWTYNLTNNQANVVQFGLSTDKPVVADYDGDGRADQAVYRNGEWHLNRSSQGYAVVNFGLATDKPVVGDYDGDDRADEAVYRNGTWYLQQSSQGYAAFQWGISSDIPAAADYDGDSKTDVAVYRDGTWYLLQSTNGISKIQQFGLANDKPVPAAYVP
jgi:glucan-binding YG repeat protein